MNDRSRTQRKEPQNVKKIQKAKVSNKYAT